MPIRSERFSERRIGIGSASRQGRSLESTLSEVEWVDNDGESGRKGLTAGMVISYLNIHERT